MFNIQFKILVQKEHIEKHCEVFNFKNIESQKLYFFETADIEQFCECQSLDLNIEKKEKLWKKMNQIFQKCFKKIQMTGKATE